MYKSLYIHIPFCKTICTYCDFKREINSEKNINIYVNKLIMEIANINHILETIYIGGGTPNILSDDLLNKLLESLRKNIDKNTEFTIELNPELITNGQLLVLKNNYVNRISLGVQSTNNIILKSIGRLHTIEMVIDAINLLKKNNFTNISCDFIYNLPNMKISDVDDIIKFINKFKINHISFYSLEIKEGSYLNKIGYSINEILEEEFLFYFAKKIKLKRYEISNWASDTKFESRHNKAYWNMNEWKGIGYGSFGFENNQYIESNGSTSEWKYELSKLTQNELYKDILIMGLRQTKGISLENKKVLNAYNTFKTLIPNNLITIKDNYLFANNIDLLNEILLNII